MSDFVRQNAIVQDFTKNSWCILNPIERSIKEKIEKIGVPLKDWDIKIYRGILTGCNEAFIIDGETKDALIAQNPKSAEIIRPILRGRDIKRYSYDFADKWLIATFPSKHYNIDDYPAIKNYLLSFGKEKLEQSGKKDIGGIKGNNARKKTNNKWFETQDTIAYWDDFSKPKIVWASVGETFYSKVDENQFLLDTNYFFSTHEPYYFLGILNSKLITFWINSEDTPIGSGGAFRHYKYNLEKLALPILDVDDRQYIEQLVKSILKSESNNAKKDIDTFIFKIFKLTKAEIDFVEKSIE